MLLLEGTGTLILAVQGSAGLSAICLFVVLRIHLALTQIRAS